MGGDMKAVVMTSLLVVAGMLGTPLRAEEHLPARPLMHAVRHAGDQLAGPRAGAAQTQTADKGWARVTSLAPGTRIVVEPASAPAATRIFVSADGSELIVLDLTGATTRIPRSEIVAIKMPPKRRGSIVGAAVGAGAGFVLGFASAVHLAYKQCNGSCSDEQTLMALSLVGFPIAGGLLGYQSSPRMTQEVIYLAPPGGF